MNSHKLARGLRQRQLNYGRAPKWMIKAMSDNDMIWSYTTCCHCQKPMAAEKTITDAISSVKTAKEFTEFTTRLQMVHLPKCTALQSKQRATDILTRGLMRHI